MIQHCLERAFSTGKALVLLRLLLLGVTSGLDLPLALVPDVAFFDVGAPNALRFLERDGSRVTATHDLLTDPRDSSQGAQRLAWSTGCHYDDGAGVGGGGSIVLDGSSCYARLVTDSCAWASTQSRGFTLALVTRLDEPPSPQARDAARAGAYEPPYSAGAYASGPVPTLATLKHHPASKLFEAVPMDRGDLVWTPTSFTRRPVSDEGSFDGQGPLGLEVQPALPPGAWTVEAVTFDAASNLTTYFRSGSEETGPQVLAMEQLGLMLSPNGQYAYIGCLWDLGARACTPGSYLAGRVAALVVYGRPIEMGEMAVLMDYYALRFAAPPHPHWPPATPPAPPLPPGTGLPPELLPDVAYFDAWSGTAGSTLRLDPASGLLTNMLDQVFPLDQYVEWSGNCRYDSSAASGAHGSVVLDGASCYGRLRHGALCSQNWGTFDTARQPFSLVMVVRLDDEDHTTLATYSRPDGFYYMYGDVLWGPTDILRRARGRSSDYATSDLAYSDDDPLPDLGMPVGRWTVEVISMGYRDEDGSSESRYYRSPSARNGSVVEVPTYSGSPQVDGDYVVLGCDWDADLDTCNGYYMKGRMAAFMAYSRGLGPAEVQQLYEHFKQRWPEREPAPPPPPPRQPEAPEHYDVKLLGSSEGMGVLLVWANKTWNTICDNGFTADDAIVACHQLGFTGGRRYRGGATPPGMRPLWTAMGCEPKQHARLDLCPHQEVDHWEDDCTHVNVRCDVPAPRGSDKPAPAPSQRRPPPRRGLAAP